MPEQASSGLERSDLRACEGIHASDDVCDFKWVYAKAAAIAAAFTWCAYLDSNQRPPQCQCGALTN